MVSIGLSVGKVPVLGVLYDPFRQELFSAYLGGGAYLNGNRISVDGVAKQLSEALVCTNMGYRRDDEFTKHVTGSICNFMKNNLRGLRMSG